MSSIGLTLSAILILAASGLPACLLPRRSAGGQRLAALAMTIGGILGTAAVALSFGPSSATSLKLGWLLPWGSFSVAVDPLSAFFLCLVFVIPALGSVYGLGYWKQMEHEPNGQRLGLSYGLLAASMAMVLISRDALLFLISWEVMALSAWFAATAENDKPEVRRAGWIYLIATHVGTLVLFAMFALWNAQTGSFALEPRGAMLTSGAAGAVFVLALVGFGFKAGFMPLHVWLPGAHANAPSHVSAVMSGVMLKMGIYGIIRMTGLLSAIAPWMGTALLAAGAVTGIAGISFAIGQRDLKRALAYSSIENIGIIGMALGLALTGRACGRADWALLGLAGALLHVWNHGLFKSLLFLNSGAIIHATGTRDVDLLGGLAEKMPFTALAFTLGAVAIAGLPPLNGFAGEWLVYQGFFMALDPSAPRGFEAMAVAAVALAAIGALAVACFVRLQGGVFQGSPRSAAGGHAHDPGLAMKLPMGLLGLACLAIGLFPAMAAPFLESVALAWVMPSGPEATFLPAAMPHIADLAPLAWVGWLGGGIALLAIILYTATRLSRRNGQVGEAGHGTWDCGYARPTARMEYTASSFGQSLVGLLSFILWPTRHGPKIKGSFPAAAKFRSELPDPILDRALRPLFRLGRIRSGGIRSLQQGQTQLYILYILGIAIVLLLSGGRGVSR